MDLTEAKQILKKSGYICEKEVTYILYDKYENDEAEMSYGEVYGPCSWNDMETYIQQNCTKDISEIPLDPTPSQEPEEGFILITCR